MANSWENAEEVGLAGDAECFLKQSSAISIATYEYDSKLYRDRMDRLMSGNLDELVDTANVLIGNLAANEELDSFKKRLTGADEDIELLLHKILDAMLYHAEACGGESAKRYVAAAICACIIEPKPEDKVDDGCNSPLTLYMLRQLSTTWFTHFLFPFYFSYSAQQNQTPSPIATPSRYEMARKSGMKSRKSTFRENVFLRDGYQCIATGIIDKKHPKRESYEAVNLRACHILRRAVVNFNESHDEDAYKSAMMTFDILRHFAALPEPTLKELNTLLDDPSNRFLLQVDALDGFDEFLWCLEETEIPNKYKIRVYDRAHGIRGLKRTDTPKFVEFEDHSSEFSPNHDDEGLSTGKKRKEPEFSVPLPDPRWIRLHAGIAGVVNMSGAAKFLKLCKDYLGDDKARPVRSWEEFERLVAAEDFASALESAMIEVTTR